MKAKLVSFGEIEIDGICYTHDVVIAAGKISKRNKKPSKQLREEFGHTPLSNDEDIPWGGKQLIIGTGAYGNLPITKELKKEAKRREIEIIKVPTEDACHLIEKLKKRKYSPYFTAHAETSYL